jgi:predicted aspartyl protease
MYKYEQIQRSNRLAPVIELLAFAPSDKDLTSRSKALVDTGATITCVPESVIAELGRRNLVATKKRVAGAFGDKRPQMDREAYVISIRLDHCEFEDIEVVVLPLDKEYALIGRDILNGFSITFDGPNDTWSVRARCK